MHFRGRLRTADATDQEVAGSNPAERTHVVPGERSVWCERPCSAGGRVPTGVPTAEAQPVGTPRRGAGTLRQRKAGVWEVRVSVGPDPVTGLAVQHSVTVHGDLAEAEHRRELLAAGGRRVARAPAAAAAVGRGAAGRVVGGCPIEGFHSCSPPARVPKAPRRVDHPAHQKCPHREQLTRSCLRPA